MKEKYALLLLNKCLDLENSSYLYIHYPKEVEEFALIVKKEAEKKGIEVRMGLEEENIIALELMKTKVEDISSNSLFTREAWDIVAKENGAILFLETVLEDPFQNVDSARFEELMKSRRNSKPIYNQKLDSKELSWCIASYPSKYWAEQLFPKDSNGYQKLLDLIYQVSMVDKENSIKEWEKELEISKKRANYLNSLKIKSLYYHNQLGTNFTVSLPSDYQFCSAGEVNAYGKEVIVNMPSYEIFTSPDYRTTEGVIYSSKPLFYQGKKIENFVLTFQKGKVVDIKAQFGEEILSGIVNGEETSCYLGELALVDTDSPISRTGKVFQTTLLDENAACHVALGCGFSEAIKNGEKMTSEERYKKGINKSKTHVDFMIGTPDLKIEAITEDNQNIVIFENGNFVCIE